MKLTRRVGLAAIVIAALFFSACDPNLIGSFRAGFGATKPFIQTLVSQGVISQAKADSAIKDVDDGLDFAAAAQTCESAAGNSKPAKAQCYLTLANNLRSILERHNIGGSPQLDRIAAIAQAAVAAFEAYHRSVNATSRSVAETAGIDPDKQLQEDLKAVKKDLKALTGK